MQIINYTETNFSRDEQSKIDDLRNRGFFVYALRDGEGRSYTIEKRALINNIGFLISDTDLSPFMTNDFVDEAELFGNESISWIYNHKIGVTTDQSLLTDKSSQVCD